MGECNSSGGLPLSAYESTVSSMSGIEPGHTSASMGRGTAGLESKCMSSSLPVHSPACNDVCRHDGVHGHEGDFRAQILCNEGDDCILVDRASARDDGLRVAASCCAGIFGGGLFDVPGFECGEADIPLTAVRDARGGYEVSMTAEWNVAHEKSARSGSHSSGNHLAAAQAASPAASREDSEADARQRPDAHARSELRLVESIRPATTSVVEARIELDRSCGGAAAPTRECAQAAELERTRAQALTGSLTLDGRLRSGSKPDDCRQVRSHRGRAAAARHRSSRRLIRRRVGGHVQEEGHIVAAAAGPLALGKIEPEAESKVTKMRTWAPLGKGQDESPAAAGSATDEGNGSPATSQEVREAHARGVIQAFVRGQSLERGAAMTMLVWWDSRVTRTRGPLLAHVLFLQALFRVSRARWPSCWARGGRRGTGRVIALRRHRCGRGRNLASEEEMQAQKDLCEAWLSWYDQYVQIERRLNDGRAPGVLHLYCGSGGSSEGGRRAGASGIGVDSEDQPDYVRRFGTSAFVRDDATSWAVTARLQQKHGFVGAGASPPCKSYSRALSGQASRAPRLIGMTRDLLRTFFEYFWIENVKGAREEMDHQSVELFGQLFGLSVDRARLIENSFGLRIDEAVMRPGRLLRERTCLGRRRRWRRFDGFGRPEAACCAGNLWAVQGVKPWRCTTEECSRAMDIDVGTMEYDRLAQAIPPAYSRLIIGQMCMRAVHDKHGVPMVSFDEFVANPDGSRRKLEQWLRGAGDDSADAGMGFVQAMEGSNTGGASPRQIEQEPMAYLEANSDRVPGHDENLFREIYYSHIGGFDQRWTEEGAGHWLDELRPNRAFSDAPSVAEYRGHNTFVDRPFRQVLSSVATMVEAAKERGSRISVKVERRHASALGRLGFRNELGDLLDRLAEEPDGSLMERARNPSEASDGVQGAGVGWRKDDISSPRPRQKPTRTAALEAAVKAARQDASALGWSIMSIGARGHPGKGLVLDHDRCEKHMDPRDAGVKTWADRDKRLRAWRPVWHTPDLWRDRGLPAAVEELMTEGAHVEMERSLQAREVAQYPFASSEACYEASIEADRAVATGHMEYVPAAEIEGALADGVVHAWTMAQQGEKWRACQDYSAQGKGTNSAARSAPFGLPTAWSVKRIIKPGQSKMLKYDLRDGFWMVPVSKGSRNRLMMRHPASGRLMRCARLPFGFVDSPRLFCSVTEALAQVFRQRASQRGLAAHIFCYVDDYLLVGDDEVAALEAGDLLEQIFHEFGVEWAPQKQRGPCSCIEFLGLMIANFEEVCCIGLSRARQGKVQGLLDEWATRRPRRGKLSVNPVELARLLGVLVFASQVVPKGRVYMQGMLAQFQGLEVDWHRGQVRTRASSWGELQVTDTFWRDLEWWQESFATRNCTSLLAPERGEAAITGTDASGWGSGQVSWIDGGKEESRLRFGAAETRRPINWRELSGIVRVLELYGQQLHGRCLLIETDNTSAKGAADKSYSKASDMQELIRRLCEMTEEQGITVRFTHTPGAKLHRPDQNSRGDPIEEPRVRMGQSEFKTLSRRFGPFSEYIGAERQHATPSANDDVGPRLWVHPTYTTVGSALRLIGERLMADDGARARGIIIVPDSEEAQWKPMLSHFCVVGRRPVTDSHLEISRLGAWAPVRSQRPTLVLSFPRNAGTVVRVLHDSTPAEGYVPTPGVGGWHLPTSKGALVYRPAPTAGTRGTLYIVWADFDIRGIEDLFDGRADVQLAELIKHEPRAGSKKLVKGKARSPDVYALVNTLVRDKDDDVSRPQSFHRVGSKPWREGAEAVWSVDHLVQEIDPPWPMTALKAGAGQAAQWARKAFEFDFKEAERQIAGAMAQKEVAVTATLPLAPESGQVERMVQAIEGISLIGSRDDPEADGSSFKVDSCARVGCDRDKYHGKDYCGRKCAILDGALPAPSPVMTTSTHRKGLKTIFFYNEKEGEHACLSQWYPSPFVDSAGNQYTCGEQYMMASKARTFGDDQALGYIMEAGFAPAKIKQIGRMVQPFSHQVWEGVRELHVARGNYLKFSQNEQLKKVLLSTGEAQLAEASYDEIWGIGLMAEEAIGKDAWPGLNKLGVALEAVRAALNAGIKIEPAPTLASGRPEGHVPLEVLQSGLALASALYPATASTDSDEAECPECEPQSAHPLGDEARSLAGNLLATAGGASAFEKLRAAIDSAAEAANARVRPPTQSMAQGAKVPALEAKERRQRMLCRYPNMPCAGCGLEMAVGTTIAPAGDGMVHDNEQCKQLARTHLLNAVQESQVDRTQRKQKALDSEKRQAQIVHRFSDDRLEMVSRCLAGKCTVTCDSKGVEPIRIFCRGARGPDGVRVPCGCALHPVTCAQITVHQAKVGMMVCIQCRVLEMTEVSAGSTDTLRKAACRSMLLDLTTGATSTAKNVADFERLEREWMASMRDREGKGAEHLRPPRESEESFKAFMLWLVTDGQRASSFATIMRMAGIAMARMEIPVITSRPTVKLAIKEIATQIGTDSEPCTIPSTAIIRTMLDDVLPKQSHPYILARSLVQFDMETAGGCRVGETVGAGDGHGALAELVDIARPLNEYGLIDEESDETINVFLEDTKNGFSRDATYQGVTKGPLALECARHLRELWRISGFKLVTTTEDGMSVTRPDYGVVRVSLLGMPASLFTRFLRLIESLEGHRCLDVTAARSWILAYAKERYDAKTTPEEERYVNIAGGSRDGPEIRGALELMTELGFEGYVDVTAGPLLRATASGKGRPLTHMPIKVKSTYANVPAALMEAWNLNKKRGVVDTELDLEGLEKPKFGHHANRRKADKQARDSRDLTGCTEGDIDDHFGWDQKSRKKKSQLHYRGRLERIKRARTTMYL